MDDTTNPLIQHQSWDTLSLRSIYEGQSIPPGLTPALFTPYLGTFDAGPKYFAKQTSMGRQLVAILEHDWDVA